MSITTILTNIVIIPASTEQVNTSLVFASMNQKLENFRNQAKANFAKLQQFRVKKSTYNSNTLPQLLGQSKCFLAEMLHECWSIFFTGMISEQTEQTKLYLDPETLINCLVLW